MIDYEIPQHSDEWFKKRLGYFTGSEIGKLMHASRKSGEIFGETAKSYIFKKAAERDILKEVLDDSELWKEYLYQTSVSSKAMTFGTNQEPYARELYETMTGRTTKAVGVCTHPTIPYFASSPDGLYENSDTGERGCIEIKVPQIDNYFKYRATIKTAEDLKEVNPDYYYQCLAHIACTGSEWTDFICYQPFLKHFIHIVRVERDENAIREMEERVGEANRYIDELNTEK